MQSVHPESYFGGFPFANKEQRIWRAVDVPSERRLVVTTTSFPTRSDACPTVKRLSRFSLDPFPRERALSALSPWPSHGGVTRTTFDLSHRFANCLLKLDLSS